MFGNISGNKSNVYIRGWLTFDWENFILDCFSVSWELKIDELNAEITTQIYLDKINMLLDTYAPLKGTVTEIEKPLISGRFRV